MDGRAFSDLAYLEYGRLEGLKVRKTEQDSRAAS